MSVQWLLTVLLAVARQAPELWPKVEAAFQAAQDLVDAIQVAIPRKRRAVKLRKPTSEEAALILQIEEAFKAQGVRAFGDGAFFGKFLHFAQQHPEFAMALASLIKQLLASK